VDAQRHTSPYHQRWISSRSGLGGIAAVVLATAAAGVGAFAPPAVAAGFSGPYVGPLTHTSTVASTVPANGDVNPYGVAVVPRSTGDLIAGDVLVSNFNNQANLQGTGTTIVEVSPSGQEHVFADLDSAALDQSLGGVGLTTALAVLDNGWVVVGDLPTTNGTTATATPGGLIVLNAEGQPVRTITGPLINGPWDLTAVDYGNSAELFVTNVLNGGVSGTSAVVDQGTVVRIALTSPRPGFGIPTVQSEEVIGSGFAEQANSSALVVGPTGVGLGDNGNLYVADTLNNRVAAIPDALYRNTSAGTGNTISEGGALNTPLGLTIAPNGDVLTVNGGNGNLVDLSADGRQAASRVLDTSGSPAGAGALFGLAIAPGNRGVYYVDDATNTLNLLAASAFPHN
jgi:hypothetical protein